ncbi:MAG: nicotinate-nucleotide adenylyltransferase [Deltaproteobacteria bacterium]|nr:nicotinate-nucleotide adenylyltransferase [Deltaproteobacteria bacterium]
MKIGLFGGTFNPIHIGHLRVAVEVKALFALDKVYLIPAALPPHKEPGGVSEAKDRMEMTRLAVSNLPDFIVSDVELNRSGPSYTIDTVLHFKSALPNNPRLYFILGLDAFLEIDTWKSYRKIFQLIPVIVMARPDTAYSDTTMMWETLEAYLKLNISDGYRFNLSDSCYVHDEMQPVHIVDVLPVDISSTMIRKRINEGRSIHAMVPENVEDFITDRGLYL